MFRGIFTALVTPFDQLGRIEEDTYVSLIERQIAAGIQGIVPTGTTGEAATLGYNEHYRVIELAVSTANHRVPVIAGVGSNSTIEGVGNIIEAQKRGVDGLLIVTPYYNKPPQAGLTKHYLELAEAATVPIILYNVPGRTGVNLEPATVAQLAQHPRIVGIKEASGSMRQVSDIIRLVNDPTFTVISGDDSNNLPIYSLGGQGAISVASNVAPELVVALWAAWQNGNIAEAQKLHYALERLNQILFIESNPLPAKTAMAMMGLIQEEFRSPLCPMTADNHQKLHEVLVHYSLV